MFPSSGWNSKLRMGESSMNIRRASTGALDKSAGGEKIELMIVRPFNSRYPYGRDVWWNCEPINEQEIERKGPFFKGIENGRKKNSSSRRRGRRKKGRRRRKGGGEREEKKKLNKWGAGHVNIGAMKKMTFSSILKIEAPCFSETLCVSTRSYGVTSQKAVFFYQTGLSISNLLHVYSGVYSTNLARDTGYSYSDIFVVFLSPSRKISP